MKNFIYLLLNVFLVRAIISPVAFAMVPISAVSSKSVGAQVIRLEHILGAHSELLAQLQRNISDNQVEIDSLLGQIQENHYLLDQVVEQQKQILVKMDNLLVNSVIVK